MSPETPPDQADHLFVDREWSHRHSGVRIRQRSSVRPDDEFTNDQDQRLG